MKRLASHVLTGSSANRRALRAAARLGMDDLDAGRFVNFPTAGTWRPIWPESPSSV